MIEIILSTLFMLFLLALIFFLSFSIHVIRQLEKRNELLDVYGDDDDA